METEQPSLCCRISSPQLEVVLVFSFFHYVLWKQNCWMNVSNHLAPRLCGVSIKRIPHVVILIPWLCSLLCALLFCLLRAVLLWLIPTWTKDSQLFCGFWLSTARDITTALDMTWFPHEIAKLKEKRLIRFHLKSIFWKVWLNTKQNPVSLQTHG